MRQIYMDHSATTPIDQEVFECMIPYLTDRFGNPSSIFYSAGQTARQAVEKAREQVASLLNALPDEVVFTSGGTEADNLAIVGYAMANRHKGNHIITSSIEHHAVYDTCKYLSNYGFEVTFLPVDGNGIVEPETLKTALKPNTTLVSIMHANNEIGTVEPIKELASITHEAGAAFHCDAVQTVGRIPVDVVDLGVDMLSASSHKLYGPKGVGCLYVRTGITMQKLLHGGGQEKKRRAGTENVPGIVGFGKAAELAQQRMDETGKRLRELGERLAQGLLQAIPYSRLTGHPVKRIPGHVSLCFEFVEGESILLMLDQVGVMASSGSACTSGSLEPSHVLLALGLPHEIAHGSLRLTLGKGNSEEDVDHVLNVLPPIVERLRQMSPLNNTRR
ncbi:MAG: cysteine desulfurase NifS [Syntrophothermus sp.]|uniref:cysteine desulfurase NifS n=1 Tax=Syntrophothermus sp. TaxID=2736299 RepID=UPI00257CC3EA|nr:cysteine desulfurase NifS [Syntrophothermus sp.]NSW81772.1 cysteine desulfurase NifS [Syntrophothermus sp.]